MAKIYVLFILVLNFNGLTIESESKRSGLEVPESRRRLGSPAITDEEETERALVEEEMAVERGRQEM